MNNESDKKTDINVCVSSNTSGTSVVKTTAATTTNTWTGTSKNLNSKNKNCNSVSSVGVGQINNNSSGSNSVGNTGGTSSNANGKNMSTTKSTTAMAPASAPIISATNSNPASNSGQAKVGPSPSSSAKPNGGNITSQQLAAVTAAAAAAQSSALSSSGAPSAALVNSLPTQTALQHLVSGCKLTSTASSPTRSDTDTFSELQPRVTDLSESDEESVSEILLACLCLRPDLLVDSFPIDQDEIPDSGSESCGNDVEGNDDEDDGDDEDEDEDDEIRDPNEVGGNFLLDPRADQRNFKALFEAAANEKAPVLRHATLAIDEATQALNKMRCASSPRDKTILSRTLIAACTDNDVNTVRRLLGKGNISINESTDDGESLLSMACSAGYYELAQVLLAMSATQVEDKGQKDCTPLMEAASAGHLDIIKLLLSHKADVNAQCTTGNTPLMFACAGGHVEVVKELLKHGANVEDQNENGHTPLMEAASAGHVEVAKVLLEHGAGINTHSNEFKESALTLACYKGHLNMVRFLLQAGADQEHKTDEMHTALMEASMDGHVEVARLLLDSGAQVNMPTDSFESPLTLAACGGHVELATLLIERGANIEEVNDEGYTPLMEAAREGHEDMVALLLSKGANINATTEETQETALTLACCGGFMEVAEFLIKQGADLELGASTPLMEAAQEGHTDLVRFLLENGANVHAQTQTGDTALTHACENGHTDAAEVLLYYGAELEHESEGGRTPLMKACRAGHICTVKFLISKGADVNKQTTSNDHTALSLACAGGHQAVVELLLKSGADPFHKLKDNSTMLIEAAKGGHIRVVETLFKYPHFLLNQNGETATNGIPNNNNNGQIQMQPINLQQQKQLQQQLQQLTAPPGLHEVPEAVRVSNQQIFHQQQFQSLDYLDEQAIASATETLAGIEPNPRTLQQQEALIAKMRLFQFQAGFEDGLAHGLSRAQPGVVNQTITQSNNCSSQNNANIQANLTTNNNMNNANQNTTNTNKQKSLLRKNRQPPAPFELNLTSSEAQQVRSQPLLEDENSVFVTTNMTTTEDQQQQRRKIIEEFQKKANIQLVCDPTNGPQSMPYVDITTASAQGLMYSADGMTFTASNGTPMMGPVPPGAAMQSASLANFVPGAKGADSNNSFLLTSSLPTLQSTAAASAAGASGNQQQSQQIFASVQTSTNTAATSTTSSATTTQITTPSEVSQSTAISDRPKVKPVSKKDAKSLRKAATVLQPMVSIYNNLPLLLPTEPSYQPHQQAINSISMSGQQLQMESQSLQQALQQLPSSVARGSSIFQQAGEMTASSATSSTSSSESTSSSATSSSADQDDPVRQLVLNTQLSCKMLQAIAQIPNRPSQKTNQRMIVDQPKSPTETPPACDSDKTPDSPTKTEADFVDISRALREAVRDFRPDLNTSDIVQALQLQPIPHLMPHKPGSISSQQQFTIQSGKSQHTAQDVGTFANQHDDHFRMYPVDNADDESIGIYPALGESLDTFTTEDDGTRDQICSYELGLGDCMDDIFNVFQGVSDPTFQELTTNLNCSEFAEFGINSFCKTRWAGQWVPSQQAQDILNHQTATGTSNVCIGDDQADLRQQANQLLIDHQLQQQLTHRLTVEEMQIYNQLQNQHQQTTLSLIPISAEEQQQHQNQPPNIGIQTLPNPSALQSQQQQQTQTNPPNNTSTNLSSTLLQLPPVPTSIQQSQQQLIQQHQQQQQILSGDAQQQAKFVFNVDSTDKPQSLQLLFQLPPVQQGQQQQPAAIITAQQQQQQPTHQVNTQAIAQTQTAVCQPVQTQVTQTNLNLQQHSLLTQPQTQQHSQQVQVATQTQQQPVTSGGGIISSGPSLYGTTLQTAADGSTISSQQQTTTTKSASGAAKKALDKASRKERNRYTVMRQTPAGSQANTTTQQYPTQGASTAVDKTIDVDSETDSNHDTALTLACAGGHEELVELLINRGANIEHRDKKGFTPLILAATAGHEKVVTILLKHGAELEAQSERTKDTPLSLACSGGRYEVVQLLLSLGANKEHRNVSDYTPLSLAASGGYVNIIKLLLSEGAEINSRTGSKLGISPLMLAAMNGHTAAVKLLLDMGSDINAQIETNRNTALTLACFQGRHEVVSLLLDRKANVEHRAKTGLTPLMEAASGGYIEVGRVLLDKGADVNAAPVPTSRDTALTIAADKGHLKFVELLLSRAAAVEVKNKKGNSPLWLAAHGGHLAVVEVLFTHGADIDSQDNRRVSCLMAAFRKGHTKVVKWMVQHVTQFPSDQEMTRFISTISDKELLEKCYDCVKIIRAAKEAQAVKANKNASILLEELDMERTREESRRAAAARRRERKKKKKLEKKEEKRKLLEGMNSTEQGAEGEKESEKEEDSEKEENEEVNQQQDREEGDSGIDQGSCSSTDMKATNVQPEKSNKAKNKKKKNNANKQNGDGSNRGSNSPVPVPVEPEKQPQAAAAAPVVKKKEEVNNNNSKTKKESATGKVEPKKPTERQENINKKDEIKKKELPGKDPVIKPKEKEKENLAPKEENVRPIKHIEKKIEATCSSSTPAQKQHINTEANIVPHSSSSSSTGNRKSMVFSARHPIDKDDNLPSSKPHRHHDDKISPTKPLQSGAKRGEDGWKEVVRKSSIQQQATSSTTTITEMTCKKVQVPVHAISRVIGRAGSNINAIRATTGAHIEVEKQGKAQSDRWITIKGLADATKQAHLLISTLIKDPDVDILQMLPRVNPSAKPPPLVVNSWDKNTPLTQSIPIQPSITSTASSGSSKGGKLIQASTSISSGKLVTSSSGSNNSKSISTSRVGSKQGFISSTRSTIAPSISNVISRSSNEFTNPQKRGASVVINGNQSVDSLSGGTKTTMSYTNAIMSLKNAAPKSSSGPGNHAQQPTGTFASKLTSSTEKKGQMANNYVVTSQCITQNQISSTFHSSPKKPSNMYDVNNLLSFGPTRKGITLAISSTIASGLSTTFTSTSDTITCSSNNTGRSITPIGPPSNLNRNISSSPLLQAVSQSIGSETVTTTTSALCSTASAMVMQPPGLASQLQNKISHEYTLFNDSYNNQWESKQMYNTNANDPLPKADASKAPGYNRGNVMSSPVSSKTSSNSTTPPGSSVQTPGQAQNLNILPVSVSATSPAAPHSAGSQSGGPPVPPEVYTSTAGELNSVLKPVSQNVPPVPQPPSSGLAIQRPNTQNRPVTSQIDNYGPIGSNTSRDQAQSSTRGYFDQIANQNMTQQHSMNYPDALQQQYHQHMNVNQHSNPLQMSRLNPRASVFSQQNKSSQQQLSGMFHQNNSNIGLNSYQKMSVGSQNVGGNSIPTYNPAPGRPQSQPQAGSNARWFASSDYGYMPSSREILNLENGLAMGPGSPAMSPNNPQPQANGIISQASNQPPPPIPDDTRKIPRPIGTERASWKYNNYPNMNAAVEPETNSAAAGPIPPWMMEKTQSQQQPLQQNWAKSSHPRYYPGDMHPQDHFHQLPQMDYHNALLPPTVNPAAMNLMPTFQYPHFVGHADMSQMPEKIEPWEHDKHGWSSNWTN